MSSPIIVKGGIYIDMECSCVRLICNGFFIPIGYQTGENEREFQEDLKAFLDKWFAPCTSGISCAGKNLC